MKRMAIGIAAAAAAALTFVAPAAAQEVDEAIAALDESTAAVERAIASADAAMVEAEAADFMQAYGRELLAGDRAAIAGRYHRGGAWRVGHGQKSFESWPAIKAFYLGEHWARPAAFAWRDLSYEVLGPDAVVVVGLFDWTRAEGTEPLTFSYTGLLVREDGELRIRLEDESGERGQ